MRSISAVNRSRFTACVMATIATSLVLSGCGTTDASSGANRATREIVVGAASDLRPAFTKVAADFTSASGIRVTLSFGGSGQLKRQIEDGAPIDVFASADRALVENLVDQGLAQQSSLYTYGYVSLALVTAQGIAPASSISALSGAEYRRIAIANPAIAPYGRAARQAIDRTTAGSEIVDKLVLAENVADALRLVESGDVDAAIVATSLTKSTLPPFSLTTSEVSTSLYDAIPQAVAITAINDQSKLNARAFVEFLKGPSGKMTMQAYGFRP